MIVILGSILIPLIVGLVLKWLIDTGRLNAFASWDTRSERASISWMEYGVTAVLLVAISFSLVSAFGPEAQRAEKIGGYKEFWNGSVVSTWSNERTCTRDGSCLNTYKCDRWVESIYHPAQYDSKGNLISAAYTEYREHWHSCPYATREFFYGYSDSIGRNVPMFSGLFEENPREWRAGSGLPNVGRGIPERWARMKASLEAGDAEPVTKVNEYENYILPSEDAVLKRYSDSIEKYKKAKILPHHTGNADSPLFDHQTRAMKVSFLGSVGDQGARDAWNEHLMRFNAQLGSELRGDLHIVAVEASKVSNPDDYVNAIVAHWQSNLKKWGFPKNGIAMILGVEDGKIRWARAKTGMPEGNGAMLTALQIELDGVDFDPASVLGWTSASVNDGKASFSNSGGIAHRIIFEKFPFARACMKCDDASDKGTGYVYLKDSIPVSSAPIFWTFFAVFVVSLILWGLAIVIPKPSNF